jgi:hypothetical protein
MATLDVRVKANGSAGKFRRPPFTLTDRWSTVDLRRPDVRQGLLDHVGGHVVIHPADVARLGDVGLELVNGRLLPKGSRALTPIETAHARIAELEAEIDRLKAGAAVAAASKKEGQRKSAAA